VLLLLDRLLLRRAEGETRSLLLEGVGFRLELRRMLHQELSIGCLS
jgi:hypothetical protein